MIICFNGLKVVDCTIVKRERRIARTVLRSEDTEIVTTLPYVDDENSFGFRPKASDSYTMMLSTRGYFPKSGVLREMEVSSYSVDADNIDESSTRINLLLVNRKDLSSEIEINWCKDSDNYKEILDNLEVGNTLYVSTGLELGKVIYSPSESGADTDEEVGR